MRFRTAILIPFLLLIPHFAHSQNDAWIATWAASPTAADADTHEPLLNIEDQTVRMRVRVSAGGTHIRLRLSNEYGSYALLLGSVTVALPNGATGVQADSIRRVTFSGSDSVVIPAGAPILSDAISFPLASGAEISISLYFPGRVRTVTWHSLALKRAVVSGHGDHTRDERIEGNAQSESAIAVNAVLVPAQPALQLIVAFGDSIVDGDGSTVDEDRNWTSDLIRRLHKASVLPKLSVVNEGIAGNRLLGSGPLAIMGVNALARWDRDALNLPGVTHVILYEGINDLGFPGAKLGDVLLDEASNARNAGELIDAYRQLVARAHTRGVKVIGCTLAPFEGVTIPGYYSEAKENTRQKVNRWIRSGGGFDGVIDFDQVLRDPDHPSRLAPRYASNDHLHPNDAGYQAMADAIDLSLLQ